MKKKHWILLAGLTVVGAGSYGGYAWWQAEQVAAAVQASLPPRPDLTALPLELQQRVARCEARAKHGPGRVAALVELATLYHANSFFEEATQCYQGLLTADPGNVRWAHRLAMIISGFGRLEEATQLWQFVVARTPEYVPAQIRLGDVLLKANRFDEAVVPYQAALQFSDDNPYALVGLARIAMEKGRWQEARERLERASAKSGYAIGSDLLVTVYEKLGQEGRAVFLRGRQIAGGTFFDPPDPWVDEIFFDCYTPYRLSLGAGAAERAGNSEDAMRLWARALALDPNYVPVLYQLGSFYLRASETTKALEYFRRCTEADPKFPDGWIYVAFILAKQGDAYGAELALAKGLSYCPNSPGLHLDRGRRRFAAGRYQEALEDFDANCRLRPEEGAGHVAAAKLYVKTGEIDQALARLRQALQAEPGLVEALQLLTMGYISVGDEARARECFVQVNQHPRIKPEERAILEQAFQEKFGKLL